MDHNPSGHVYPPLWASVSAMLCESLQLAALILNLILAGVSRSLPESDLFIVWGMPQEKQAALERGNTTRFALLVSYIPCISCSI